eukprot:364952-Chlamydomonas_euryale.AAC.15
MNPDDFMQRASPWVGSLLFACAARRGWYAATTVSMRACVISTLLIPPHLLWIPRELAGSTPPYEHFSVGRAGLRAQAS